MSEPRAGNLLFARLRAVWRRTQILHATAGALALCRWAIPIFLVAIVVDRPAFLPAAVRGVLLVGLLGIALYKAWRCGWRRMRRFDATRVALQLEQTQGGLESLLVTAVQLGEGRAAGASVSLREQIRRVAEERAAPLRPQEAVPYQGLRRPGAIALPLVGVLVIFGAFDGPFLTVGLQRIFTPWVAVAYPTATQLAIRDGDRVVRQGDEATIEVLVSGVVPSQARLSLQTGSGRPRVRSLEIVNGVCAYTIASASRDFTYRIHAGDARSDWHRVTVVPSPRITEVRAVLTFPPYLQREPETVSGLTLTVPEATHIHWTLTMDRPLREASLIRDDAEAMPLSLTADGRQVILSETAKESRGYRFEWVEGEHGFRFASPRHYLQVQPDRPPRVALTQPADNLYAILGRKVEFAVRAQDDHGIGGASISYRVNLRPNQTEKLSTPIRNGGGDQVLDWDYRAVIPNLKIGDTVAFYVEIRDRYTGPGGPHVARSDTRRITFLSREDYLAEIAKRKDRLLSRVRDVYRQQRAAFDLVAQLNPDGDAYAATVQLESSRQEMLRGELAEVARAVRELIDDLTANGVMDAREGEQLDELQGRLTDIAENHIARAAGLLRESGDPLRKATVREAGQAIRAVDVAARELARLVLLRDIDSAVEVFGREARAIARNGAGFRRAADGLEHAEDAPTAAALVALADEQETLAQWTRTLLAEIEAGMHYTKRPLAVLNLTRRIKDLRDQGVIEAMEHSAARLRERRFPAAMARQLVPIRAFIDAESSVRRGVEYNTLLAARDHLLAIEREWNENQAAISDAAAAGDSPVRERVRRRAALRKELAGILLPAIPAPPPRLFDATLPPTPDVEALVRRALAGMATAENPAAATTAIRELVEIVRARTDAALVELAGVGRAAGAIGGWTLRIAGLEARQIGLLEETDTAAMDEKPCAPLAAAQLMLAQDTTRFQRDIRRENTAVNLPERDLAPLLGRMERALEVVAAIVPHLQENRHDPAVAQQERAADILSDILIRTGTQGERYAMLESLLAFARSVRQASRHVADIAAEQRDIMAAIDGATPEEIAKRIPAQKNLRRCVVDVAPLLDFVAGQLDVGTPLAFTGADMADAIEALNADDRVEALDALDAASTSMEEVTARMLAMSRRVGYLAEIVDALDASLGDSGFAAFAQEQLREKLAADTVQAPERLLAEQRALLARAEDLDDRLVRLAGPVPNLVKTAALIDQAAGDLRSGNGEAATARMTQAAATLDRNADGLLSLIKMINGLPKINLATTEDETLHLLQVLALASEQHELLRATQAADAATIGDLAERQQQLASRCQDFRTDESPHPKLVAAHQSLEKAAEHMQSASRAEALAAQEAAGTAMRHFILGQALRLETAMEVAAMESSPDAPPSGDPNTSGSDLAQIMGDVGAFVSGEIPGDKRAEWEILQQRGRAALHENFARELPLEYRDMLKSYFEKVAK